MSDPLAGLLDSTRILFELQQANEIAQSISGCLEPEEIAHRVTDGLVQRFDCAFARLWLLEADQSALKLVASSGMYTHTNGFFARVPMGAYKVGKIAQNRVSFLSNNLPEETWVGNREWAIANQIRGFAGYPLIVQDRVLGVLALFSHQPLAAEFLEVLQTLCMIGAIALDTALQHQQRGRSLTQPPRFNQLPLSDQFATILHSARLALVGTEQTLPLSITHLFLQAAEILQQLHCTYGRLIYTPTAITLEATVPVKPTEADPWVYATLNDLQVSTFCLGGALQIQPRTNQKAVQVVLTVPYPQEAVRPGLRIQCQSSVLQLAFTQLALGAGLQVCPEGAVPLLTDDSSLAGPQESVIWVHWGQRPAPRFIKARVDLTTTPAQLRELVQAIAQGQSCETEAIAPPPLSDRELEMMVLLSQGLRDRDIANQLIISESTVKFHINNILSKLKARTRYQALHQVITNGWI